MPHRLFTEHFACLRDVGTILIEPQSAFGCKVFRANQEQSLVIRRVEKFSFLGVKCKTGSQSKYVAQSQRVSWFFSSNTILCFWPPVLLDREYYSTPAWIFSSPFCHPQWLQFAHVVAL